MNPTTLSSMTLATIDNYRNAANQAARAYQLGSQRLIAALNDGMDKNVHPRAYKVAPQVASTLRDARSRVTGVAVKGIDEVTSRIEGAVDMSADTAAKQVAKAADFIAGIENQTLANGLQTVARLSLPGAKVALAVSSRVADGAKALSGAARGKGFKAAAADTVTTVRRVARKAATVSTKATKAAKATKPVKAVKRTAVRAKRKLA